MYELCLWHSNALLTRKSNASLARSGIRSSVMSTLHLCDDDDEIDRLVSFLDVDGMILLKKTKCRYPFYSCSFNAIYFS